VDLAILSKFGFERDLNIGKLVLLLNPTPGVDFQLHMAVIFKIFEIDMTSQLCREWFCLGDIW